MLTVYIFFSALLLVWEVETYITWIAVRLPLEGIDPGSGAVWPFPLQQTNFFGQLKTIDPSNFQFSSNIPSCDVIDQAIGRYRKWIVLENSEGQVDQSLPLLTSLDISVTDSTCGESYFPALGDNETYSLIVSTTSATATLQAQSIWGALRGLETFSQLLYLTPDNKFHINITSIQDSPRYSYRGLMIDTSRHYYKLNTIINILDAMSMDKLNVLHWHIVDDQSFPYESQTFPNLSQYGAYTPYHIYSKQDIQTVLTEARLRGIRVIPEFDTPGHTWSWGRAFPELITPSWGKGIQGGPHVPDYPNHGPDEIVNPMLESTYSFLAQLFQEIVKDFPDKYIHLGMDEVYYACWQSNPNISQWMTTMGFTQYNEIERYYSDRLINIINSLEASYIIWQDPIDNNVTANAQSIVEVWKDTANSENFDSWHTYAQRVTERGYNMILSAPWYLNIISYGQDWRQYYLTEPESFTNNTELHQFVKGGEACAWSEYTDGTNILSILWPRLSAIAERLWSSKDVTDVESAKFRLDQQRCRMLRRGIPAKPILNGYCGDYEWEITHSGSVTTVKMITFTTITLLQILHAINHYVI